MNGKNNAIYEVYGAGHFLTLSSLLTRKLLFDPGFATVLPEKELQ